MSETADLNDSTESLFKVFRGRLFQFRIVCGKKDCCLSCKRVGGIWYESECIFLQNLNGDMSMSVLGIATSSCEILYNMTRRPGVAHYYYFLKTIENYSFIGFFKCYKTIAGEVNRCFAFILLYSSQMCLGVRVMAMVFNATFNNISVISWQSVLLVGGRNRSSRRKPPTCRKSLTNFSHNVVWSTLRLSLQ